MPETEVIYCGDNLEALPKYLADESVDLIYIDPPFNTSRQYEVFWGEAQERRAFEDRFGDVMTYLDWMRPRIHELYRALKPTGSFYYHCDAHASHYVKVELDRIFGYNNFRSEIVWKRTSAHSGARRYGPVHDTIFFYTKSDRYTWNQQYQAYDARYLASHYRSVDATGRAYTLSDLTASDTRTGSSGQPWRGFDPASKGNHWKFTHDNLERLDREGRIYWPKNGGWPRYRRYLDEVQGVRIQDIWTDIDPVNAKAAERLGYPTQKPLPLLERIIQASSDEQHVVLDAFCGCGTTLEAAAKLKRRWIGIDFSPTACRVMGHRLEARLGLRERVDFQIRDMPKSEDDLRRMPPFEFQNWAVIALGGIPNRVKSGDLGVDGRLYTADVVKERRAGYDLFGEIDRWYPIQVKQRERAGRPDIDSFETAMRRDKRQRGYFVAFGFSSDAEREIRRAQHDGLEIVPITVAELLHHERVVV